MPLTLTAWFPPGFRLVRQAGQPAGWQAAMPPADNQLFWWLRPGFSLRVFPSVSGYGLVSAYEDSGYGLVSAYFSVRFFWSPFSLSAWSSAWYQAEKKCFSLSASLQAYCRCLNKRGGLTGAVIFVGGWARGGPAGPRKCTKNIGNPYQMEDNKNPKGAARSAAPLGRRRRRRLVVFHLVRISYVLA